MHKFLGERLIDFLLLFIVVPFFCIYFVVFILKKAFPTTKKTKSGGFQSAQVCGIPFINGTEEDAIALVLNNIQKGTRQTFYYVNPHAVNLSVQDADFYRILNENQYNFPDGMGLRMAGIFEGYSLIENLNGTDMYLYMTPALADAEVNIFLLGAQEGIAKAMIEDASVRFSKMNIVGEHHGYFDRADSDGIIQKINESGAEVVLVSFGMPIQEKWIDQHRHKINAKAVFATGGLFDYYSGRIPRAPKWVRTIGMEWLFRLIKEPKRLWKRYIIGNPLFMINVLKFKYFGYKRLE